MRSKFYELKVREDLQEDRYLLFKVAPRYEYVEGKKTDKIVGYRFNVLPWSDKALGPQTVTVLDTKLPVGVQVGEPTHDTFLRFAGWTCVEYYSEFSKRKEVSVKANSVEVVSAEKNARTMPTL